MINLKKRATYNVIFTSWEGWNCKILEASSVRDIQRYMALAHGIGPWRIVSVKVRHEPAISFRW